MIERITSSRGNDFEFFNQLVCQTVKNTKTAQKIEFIFDIFANFKTEIQKEDIQKFCQVFSMPLIENNTDQASFVEFYSETH